MNKALIISGFVAIIIILTVVIFISNSSDEVIETLTGTPADNFSEKDREKFCGTGDAKSTKYIKEYKITTDCTQPQAIVMGPQGNVWFVQSNTGNLAKFSPLSESFTEYNNRFWPKNVHSMIWGLDYASDRTFWFTDDKHDSVWKFKIETLEYEKLNLPVEDGSLPQRLAVDGSKIIINDFTGNQIIFLDNIQSNDELVTYSLPSNAPKAVTADFTLDSQNNLWYTNWILDGEGVLAKINMSTFDLSIQNNDDLLQLELFSLPPDLKTPNGIAEDNFGNIWLADSSSSLIFKFDSLSGNFSKYTTSDPTLLTYGNYTGQIKSPASQPYWIEKDSDGKLVFNEQAANRIGILDPSSESLVEYSIPSKNPHWGDCENQKDCGLSKAFDFTIDDEKIWFSEWAENNIGFVDTTVPLPIDVRLQSDEVYLAPGESKSLNFVVSSESQSTLEISLIITNPDYGENLIVEPNSNEKLYSLNSNNPLVIDVVISALETAVPGEYKILLGSKTNQVSFSKFLTVFVE